MSDRFEQTDISGSLIARTGAWLTGAVALIFLAAYGFLHLLSGGSPASRLTGPAAPSPGWGEPVPASYRWLDHERNLIAIPIERAIDLTAERGLPARPKP